MTFDEQLQRSLATLADQLRDETARACLAAGAEVAAHAHQAREVAVQDALIQAREEAEATARVEIERLERHAQQMTAAFATLEQRCATDVVASERLLEAVRSLDRARSLSEILDTLVDGARHEVARVGLLLVRHGEMRGWRFSGFASGVDPAGSVVVRTDDGGIVGESVRTGGAVSSHAPTALAAPPFAALPGDRECLAVPVVVSGDVTAVLYADQGPGEEAEARSSTLKWSTVLELLARHAARCLESATAIKAVRVLTDPPEISASTSPTSPAGVSASSSGAGRGQTPPPDPRETDRQPRAEL